MHVAERVTVVCSNQREKTETTDRKIHSPGLTDESIRDAHIIYCSSFMSTSRLKIQFVSLRQ
jgi:ferredoxin-thioredoxin reductase catalytic subunit